MTFFIPSTTLTLMRGTGVDEFGDTTDTDTVIRTGLPAAMAPARSARSFAHGDQHAFRPAEGRTGVVERYVVRLRPDVDVRELDRLYDEEHGLTYLVTDVSNPHSIVGLADVRVTAIRVSATSQAVNA